MSNQKIKQAQDVASWRLCMGCGACSFVCPEKIITLQDIPGDGIRPRLDVDRCTQCGDCLMVCPGIDASHRSSDAADRPLGELLEGWGPVLEVWEGYAADPDLRFHGSSGGAVSALALYCLEREGMHGILHIAADDKKPYANRTVFSRSREEIMSGAGSRYAPASPCEGLEMIESAPGPCVFIGKPCDVTALRKVGRMRERLEENVGIALGIFCAGTPATQGTLYLLKQLHINPDDLQTVRYRGGGWPGDFVVQAKGPVNGTKKLTYKESWEFIQKYRPYRCHLCPDGTSEFADISCGDPWYRKIQKDEQGYSLVLVRTERGREILHRAMKAGFVTLERADTKILELSQKNLLLKRSSIWGRIITMKMFGIPTPGLNGYYLFKNWLSLPTREKVRSVSGTVRRIVQRKYYRPDRFY